MSILARVSDDHIEMSQILEAKKYLLNGVQARQRPFIFDRLGITPGLIREGRLSREENTFVGPKAIARLFGNEFCDVWYPRMEVHIGGFSNVQEVGQTILMDPCQKVTIRIGSYSSVAHGVKFITTVAEDTSVHIGDNVFIGIHATIEDSVIIESGTPEHCSAIGFGATLKRGCTIGKSCIIGDSATISEGVHIPNNCIVLPGVTITRQNASNMIMFDDYTQKTTDHIGLIRLENEDWGDLREIGGIFAFLSGFNSHVTKDNNSFPLMYRLIETYHRDHMSETPTVHGGIIVNIDLPKDRNAFLQHYFEETSRRKHAPDIEVTPYSWEFTSVSIDDTVHVHGILYNIGDTEIRGNTDIFGAVVNRCGDEGGTVSIRDARIEDGVVMHGFGPKIIEHSVIKRGTIIHGSTTIRNMVIHENTVLHNTTVVSSCDRKCVVGTRSILVEATITDSNIGAKVSTTGHANRIHITQSNIGKKTQIRGGANLIECQIGSFQRIGRNMRLFGDTLQALV